MAQITIAAAMMALAIGVYTGHNAIGSKTAELLFELILNFHTLHSHFMQFQCKSTPSNYTTDMIHHTMQESYNSNVDP